MSDNENVWLPAREALARTVDILAEASAAPIGELEEMAKGIILRRLANGTAEAIGRHFHCIALSDDQARSNDTKFDEIEPTDDGVMPNLFWHGFRASDERIVEDWLAGDFEFSLTTASGTVLSGAVSDVFVELSGLLIARFPDEGEDAEFIAIGRTQREGARSAGRPKGSGGFTVTDAPLVEKMRKIIADNPQTSIHAAASMFAEEAAGGAGLERKQRRLADRYRAEYGGK